MSDPVDYGTFVFGGVSFPLSGETTTPLLKDADPALYYALDFFAAMLAQHIGDRLVAEAQACDAPIAAAVAAKVPHDPAPQLTAQQFRFPLLAVYRIRNTFRRITTTWSEEESRWGLRYILPPLRDDQLERIVPILHAAALALHNRTEQGHDPAYLNDAKIWGASHAGLESIGFVGGSFGAFDGVGELVMAGWTAELVVKERAMPPLDLAALAGVDTAEDLAATGSTTVADFVDQSSDVTKPGPATG